MYERYLENLGTARAPVIKSARSTETAHDVLKGPGHASIAELSVYLCVSHRAVPKILDGHGIQINRAGRTAWKNVWETLWHIPSVPAAFYDLMREPLLTVDQVAEKVGLSARSILRDGDRAQSRYELPRHIQLSPRGRRYHPEMIFRWEMDLPLEEWMRPTKRRHRLGLKPRLSDGYPP